ncbi:SprT family zinc-dependent metalloprotease [Hyphococcus flavus]|uniref:SprT family zinc-dependent metalloprotease n=1 Tax=Hyphococcus flavus TaxID=1866326 RepID=A0AAE9ZCX0_9PROT|nr:SprT family zinc-dependent metalloprotease [Hyphococcus flavus]WDI32419.1 SprT family zinc-dependent metalloprotease [Hyphococcus flavus]
MSASHTTRTEINIREQSTPLIVRVNRRAKQLILKVDPIAGEILATAPSKRAIPEAIRFAQDRIDWIAEQLSDSLRGRPFSADMRIPFAGIEHIILNDPSSRRSVQVDAELIPAIRVGGQPEHLNRRVSDWLKREARKRITHKADEYCRALGKERRRINIRDTRTRWGSCSSEGVLSFSWRLILAPPDILDYVVAHECAHLIHMNHSPAFWRVVRQLGVDARAAATWLDQQGPALFSYGVAENG